MLEARLRAGGDDACRFAISAEAEEKVTVGDGATERVKAGLAIGAIDIR